MKAYTGFKARKATGGSAAIPAGGYVGKVISAKEVEYSWGNRLEIAFDVTEGEHAGFFKKQFDNNTADDKKWKGVCRIGVPSESDEAWKKAAFENFIYSIEESNSGYHWDWNEKALKGKMCGFIFNNFEWEMNGRRGWSTECRTTASIEDIRAGAFKIPKDRPLAKPATAPAGFTEMSTDDADDLPF